MQPKIITAQQFIATFEGAGIEPPLTLAAYNGPVLAVPVPDDGSVEANHYRKFKKAKFAIETEAFGPILDMFVQDRHIATLPAKEGERERPVEYFQLDNPAMLESLVSSHMAEKPMLADILRLQYKTVLRQCGHDKPSGAER